MWCMTLKTCLLLNRVRLMRRPRQYRATFLVVSCRVVGLYLVVYVLYVVPEITVAKGTTLTWMQCALR